jgi:hypothetical protein
MRTGHSLYPPMCQGTGWALAGETLPQLARATSSNSFSLLGYKPSPCHHPSAFPPDCPRPRPSWPPASPPPPQGPHTSLSPPAHPRESGLVLLNLGQIGIKKLKRKCCSD